MSKHNEMTRYAFISHMEGYMKKLLSDTMHADTDDFLKGHGIDGPKALEILTMKPDPNDENSAVLIKKTSIKDNGTDEDGNRLKDTFKIDYKIPRKNYSRKMRNLFINLFESNIIENSPINEEDGGGATSADASGQFETPLFGGPVRRKTMYITQEQADYLKKVVNEEAEMDTAFGNFGVDAPVGDGKKNKGNKFYDEANDHQDMMAKSWPKK